jgi:steroid delta-isomerase-like uncharacterized protein
MDNPMTMRRAYELINAGDLDGFGELLTDDFVEHEEIPGLEPTKEGVIELFRSYRSSFPDLRMEVEDIVAGDDKAVARVVATGTQTGEFMGMAPSGKQIEVQLIDIMRFDAAGKVVEHWGVMDTLSMLQQLGMVPDGPPSS